MEWEWIHSTLPHALLCPPSLIMVRAIRPLVADLMSSCCHLQLIVSCHLPMWPIRIGGGRNCTAAGCTLIDTHTHIHTLPLILQPPLCKPLPVMCRPRLHLILPPSCLHSPPHSSPRLWPVVGLSLQRFAARGPGVTECAASDRSPAVARLSGCEVKRRRASGSFLLTLDDDDDDYYCCCFCCSLLFPLNERQLLCTLCQARINQFDN